MSSRSLNKVQLIGNLTRDPELRYTPQGTAVCTVGLATNRGWTTDAGEKREETEFHRIVAWNKLAELCSQLLKKGRKIYVEGRLSTRSWTAADGTQRTTTEVVIDDMILLDKKPLGAAPYIAPGSTSTTSTTTVTTEDAVVAESPEPKVEKTEEEAKEDEQNSEKSDDKSDDKLSADDIPF